MKEAGENSGSHGGENGDDLSSGMLRRVVWYANVDVCWMLRVWRNITTNSYTPQQDAILWSV
jgi:hypothetical protein